MFFEKQRSLDLQNFIQSEASKVTFGLHFHRAFEFFQQTEGSTKVVINNRTYILKEGEAVLIFPFQLHSYEAIEEGKCRATIFSPILVKAFSKNMQFPTDNRLYYPITETFGCDNIYQQKAFAYAIIGAFESTERVYAPSKSKDEKAIMEMLLYAEKNFAEDCSLRKTAGDIFYDYLYLSKLFKAKIGVPYTTYVHHLRINEAIYLLENTSKSITEIYIDCGFSCLRTFNRVFLSIMGESATEYRNRIKK